MALIKYSIGGPITSIKDQDVVEKREDTMITEKTGIVVLCKKCGIQHMISKDESVRICCGDIVKTDNLS